MSFSSLYADVHLSILRFLSLRELAVMLRVCKTVLTAASKLQPRDVAAVELRPHQTPEVGCGWSLPALPRPRSVLRHLVSRLSLSLAAEGFPSACAPFTLRQRCPELRSLTLELTRNLAVPFESDPAMQSGDFWPLKLRTLQLGWSDVYSQGEVSTIDQMADQLRACLRVASRIHSVRQLRFQATSNLLYIPANAAPFQGQTAFPPILEPLLSLPKLTHLRISLSDYQFGSPDTRWISEEDSSVLARLPALREFQLTEHDGCVWSAQGLLPFLLHSAEAAPLRTRLTRLTLTQYGTSEEAMAMFRQLQQACPLVSATLPDESQ